MLSCSALKRRYRDRLRRGAPGVLFVYVELDPDEAHSRRWARPATLPGQLVDSQFEALESPVGEDGVLAVRATDPTERQVDAVLRWLGREPAARPADARR